MAGASGRPSLSLGASAGTGRASSDLESALADRAGASAGFDLSMPIWDRGVSHSAVESTQVDVRAAEAALQKAERASLTDVKRALGDTEAARVAAEASEARLAAARAATEVEQARYDAGAALLTELLTARADQVDAGVAAARTGVEVVRADFALAWARGAR